MKEGTGFVKQLLKPFSSTYFRKQDYPYSLHSGAHLSIIKTGKVHGVCKPIDQKILMKITRWKQYHATFSYYKAHIKHSKRGVAQLTNVNSYLIALTGHWYIEYIASSCTLYKKSLRVRRIVHYPLLNILKPP